LNITFTEKKELNTSVVVFIVINGKEILSDNKLKPQFKELLSNITSLPKFKKNKNFGEFFNIQTNKNNFQKIYVCKLSAQKQLADFENLGGNLLSKIMSKDTISASVLVENLTFNKFSSDEIASSVASGFNLKHYSFYKYRTSVRPISSHLNNVTFVVSNKKKVEKEYDEFKSISEGIFLTRDLVSEPANELYPEKFVDYCKNLKKTGIQIEVFDEKKIKSLKMNALYGVAKGSVRPPRVMIMKWTGASKNLKPLAFVGKGVTFDTGGISIKPSGGMEDMKWDMGGAAVVAGLLNALAKRKAKVNAIGIVGLVENMPDGNAQRPGDIVKSMSGQTIEVLNTDAEGRLVLADILHYVNTKYNPELMIDLATLTGAIIVALGDRYAGLFSNDDKLAEKLIISSKNVHELVWRLPLDEEFDKLLNCDIADMKNITGTRGAGSITAAQFLKRFVGKTKWAHLDIAGVTWSRKGTSISRPGGTGFGVRLLDNFVKENYEK